MLQSGSCGVRNHVTATLPAALLISLAIAGPSRGGQLDVGGAGPSSQDRFRHTLNRADSRYVVVLTEAAAGRPGPQSKAPLLAATLAALYGGVLVHVYDHVLNGFAVEMPEAAALALSLDPRVAYVIEDGRSQPPAVQANADWGLDRIDQRVRPLSSAYLYNATGAGVNVYLLDTGIRYSHQEFGGRAASAYDVTGGDGSDCYGHGTQAASLIGGATAGVAKAVAIRSVKVYRSCTDAGFYSDFLAGINWVAANRQLPAVVDLAMHSEAPWEPLDTATRDLIRAGIPTVVSAGNYNRDVSTSSPARVQEAISVGAINNNDARSFYSNYGPGVDLFAPADGVRAASPRGDDSYTTFGGTSASAPFVTGFVALFLQNNGGVAPATVSQAVTALASRDVLADVGAGSPNLLLYTGEADADMDGLPDWWETQFGLNAASANGADGASGDPDADGQTNSQEYAAGTHPRGLYRGYFAEGATGPFFDVVIAIVNTNPSAPLLASITFSKRDGTTVTQFSSVPPLARLTINPEDTPALAGAEFSTAIEADLPVVADRTMYWDAGRYGSHTEHAIPAAATLWYLAEGSTQAGFQLYYLVQNPTSREADVEVTYLRPPPAPPVVRTYRVLPNSRFNVYVNDVIQGSDVSARIASRNGVPIIVERAMYLNAQGRLFGAGHNSAGVTAPSTQWFFAEGATGSFFDLFVLLANPNDADAQVQAEYLLPDGDVVTKTYTVAGNSRFSIWVDYADSRLADTAVATRITVSNGVPIIAERAMWWPGNLSTWHEAHNSPGATVTGTRWAIADGEQGGARGSQTFLLIANTSPFAASVLVTMLLESGGTVTRSFPLNGNSRFSVDVGASFGSVGRFGALVESTGGAQIVVERALYSNAGGVVWAAGANALATRLP